MAGIARSCRIKPRTRMGESSECPKASLPRNRVDVEEVETEEDNHLRAREAPKGRNRASQSEIGRQAMTKMTMFRIKMKMTAAREEKSAGEAPETPSTSSH